MDRQPDPRQQQRHPGRRGGPIYNARFAGDAFRSAGNPSLGPYLNRLTSEIAWKRNPSQEVRTDLSG